jgi:hypothetical protein
VNILIKQHCTNNNEEKKEGENNREQLQAKQPVLKQQ